MESNGLSIKAEKKTNLATFFCLWGLKGINYLRFDSEVSTKDAALDKTSSGVSIPKRDSNTERCWTKMDCWEMGRRSKQLPRRAKNEFHAFLNARTTLMETVYGVCKVHFVASPLLLSHTQISA